MKAVTVQGDAGIEGLVYGEIPTPKPGPGEARVKLAASAINHIDIYQCTPSMVRHEMPHVMGADGAGIVDAVGGGVASIRSGEEVMIDPNLGDPTEPGFKIVGAGSEGTHAEYIVLPEQNFLPKPSRVSFEEAAAIPLALCTAYRQLTVRAGVRPGETVLIHGIGSGVNMYCLQLAVLSGARAIVTSSENRKLDVAREFGAGVCINYRGQDVAEAVMEATEGRGADVVVDNVGSATFPLTTKCVALNGRITLVGGSTGFMLSGVNIRDLYFKQVTVHTSTMARPDEFRAAINFAAEGKIKAYIDRTFPLSRFKEALKFVKDGKQMGKVVLTRD